MFRLLPVALLTALVCALPGCGASTSSESSAPEDSAAAPASSTPEAAAPTPAAEKSVSRPRIVALGDSLTAGLGIAAADAYPAVLERRLQSAGYEVEVVNAGVSGDTSAGALRRLDWALDGDVRILIIALGGNDGLRGLSVEDMKRNLSAMIERAQARKIAVLLAGMEAPPNFGATYTDEFREAFREVAEKYGVVFVPFLLQDVAGAADLNQADGIHPNPEGARRVAEHLWPALQPLLTRLAPTE